MLKKINKYLLENYPLTYHTKLPYLVSIGLVIWILSAISGYTLLTREETLIYNIEEFYFKSYFVFLHIVIVLIVLSLWLLNFYKQNPLKHCYPLQKSYYSKLLFHFTISLYLLTGAIIPFNYGVSLKFKKLVNKEAFVQDQKVIDLGEAFFLLNIDDYWIANKQFPSPFPLHGVCRNKLDSTWHSISSVTSRTETYDNLHLVSEYYNPQFLDAPYLPKEYYKMNHFPEVLDTVSAVSEIGHRDYIFYKREFRYTSKDSCQSYNVITEFADVNHVNNLDEVSLFNYKFRYNRTTHYKTLHDLLTDGEKSKLLERVHSTLNILDKYSIDNNINASLLVDYLVEKKFRDFDFTFIETSKSDYDYRQKELPIRKLSSLEESLVDEKMYYEYGDYTHLKFNFNRIYETNSLFLTLWVIFQIAFYLGLLFVWFEFTNLKSFLLTIPVVGVLAVIFVFHINFGEVNKFSEILIVLCVYLFLILISSLFTIIKLKGNKIISAIGLNILLLISVSFIFVVLLSIQENITYTKVTRCSEYLDELLYPDLANPFFFWPLSVLTIPFYFLLIKVWKAKKH